jgi:hypothetical protein
MRRNKVFPMLMAGAAGCLDLNALNSGQGDMGTMPKDLAMPTEPDLAVPDLAPGDLIMGPDMSGPVNWKKVYPTSATSQPLNAISGAKDATGTIFAVGNASTVVSGTDTNFTKTTATALSGDIRALWVASSTELWVTSTNNNRVHYSITAGEIFLEPVVAPPNKVWRGIYAKAGKNNDIVVAGDDKTVAAHWDGLAWTTVDPDLKNKGQAVWASDANFWIVGVAGGSSTSNDGKKATWTKLTDYSTDINAVTGVDNSNVFAAAKDGKLLKLNGGNSAWDVNATAAGSPELNAVWAKDNKEVWVAGVGGAVSKCDASVGTCANVSNSNLTGYTITGIWGDAKGGIYVTANNGAGGNIFKY